MGDPPMDDDEAPPGPGGQTDIEEHAEAGAAPAHRPPMTPPEDISLDVVERRHSGRAARRAGASAGRARGVDFEVDEDVGLGAGPQHSAPVMEPVAAATSN